MAKKNPRKERKLSRVEAASLRALRRVAQDKQFAHNVQVDKLKQAEADAVRAVVRTGTDIVREANDVYTAEKKEVDKWKMAEEKRIVSKYHEKLVDVRERKAFVCRWAEATIEQARETQAQLLRTEVGRLYQQLDATLTKNLAAQKRIRFASRAKREKEEVEPKESEELQVQGEDHA